jgi:hypothetical protein
MRTIAQYTVDTITFELNFESISGLYVGQVWDHTNHKMITQNFNKDLQPLINWSVDVMFPNSVAMSKVTFALNQFNDSINNNTTGGI